MPTKNHLRKLLNRTTVVAAALSLTALGGVAWAAGTGRSAPPTTTSIATGTTGSATAVCPEGTRAVSGGFTAPDFNDGGEGGIATVRYSSMRSLKRNWRVDAAGLGGGQASTGRIVAHAYCQKPPLKIRVVSATTTVPGNNVGGVTATCRRTEQAISGGFISPDFDLLGNRHPLTLSSYRVGKRGWRVDAFNVNFDSPDPADPGRLSAYAFCRKGGPRVFAVGSDVTVGGNANNSQGPPGGTQIDTRCPEGSKAISGGFDGHPTPVSDQGFSATGPIGSVRLDGATGWRTIAVPVSESAAVATSYAYCQATKKK